MTFLSIKAKVIDNTNPRILTNILTLTNIMTLTAMYNGILKFHVSNHFITEQRVFVHQAKGLGFKLTK